MVSKGMDTCDPINKFYVRFRKAYTEEEKQQIAEEYHAYQEIIRAGLPNKNT